MRRCILLFVVVGFACSSRGHDSPKGGTRLTPELQEQRIVRQAQGFVMDSNRRPVSDALISVIDQRSYLGIAFAISGRDGRFVIGLPSSPVVVTASANGYVTKALASTSGDQLIFAVAAPSDETRRIFGTVVSPEGSPRARVRVRLMNWDWPTGAAFYTTTDDAGRFQFSVDPSGSYDVMAEDPRYVSDFALLSHGNVDNALLTAYERNWVIEQAGRVNETALRELCASITPDSVQQFAGTLRSALAVGLGEATHGTREFTEVRGGLVSELIRNGWLTTIALEASWEEVARLDEYVRLGRGTALDAVRTLAYWPWRTAELVSFVEMVRHLNDKLPADKKIEFRGIDYAPPEATESFMRRQFQGTAPPAVLSGLEPLRRIVNWLELSKLSSSEREGLSHSFQALTRLAESQGPTSLLAVQGAQISQLIVESYGRDDDFRDRVMAENVLSLLSRSDKQRHIAIWAHALHLAESPADGTVPMGQYLKKHLAEKYRAIGSLFYAGSFRTYSGLEEKMVNHTVEVPPSFYFESAMHRISPTKACMLDITAATRRSGVGDWISVPKHLRTYGGLEISESYPFPPVVVPNLWSALIFVPTSTPTTPLD